MHSLFLLAVITFAFAAVFLGWTKLSAAYHGRRESPGGIGGASDPMAGETPNIRSGEEIRRSLDAARRANPIMGSRAIRQ